MKLFKLILERAKAHQGMQVYTGIPEVNEELKIISADKYHVKNLRDPNNKEKRVFLERAEKAKIFVIATTGTERIAASAMEGDDPEPLDLPFQICSFEPSPNLNEEIPSVLVGESSDTEVQLAVYGVLVYEVGPHLYDLYSLQSYYFKGKDPHWAGVVYYPNVPSASSTVASRMVRAWLAIMSRSASGVETVYEKRKTGSRSEKKRPIIRHIIRVVPKSQKHVAKPMFTKKIDWSHRWCVRGHWRTIQETTLGKNRDGEYCVYGKTWVSDFEKGPEGAPLVENKVRVFSNRGVE